MAKLTQAQIRQIETVSYHLNRAKTFLMSDRVQVATKFGNDFVAIDKQIGSDLTGIDDAIAYLNNFLEFNTKYF